MIIVTGDEAVPGSASGCNAGMAHHFGTPALSVGLSGRAKDRMPFVVEVSDWWGRRTPEARE